jgi:hypothetical protein
MAAQVRPFDAAGFSISRPVRIALLAGGTMLALGVCTSNAAPPATAGTDTTIVQTAMPGDADITAKVEERIAEIHATLKITAAQQPQFDGFASVMRENAKAMDTSFRHRVTGMSTMNAADNMQSYADVSMQHAQGMQKMVPAFRALYTVLSAEQKRAADETFVERAHHGIDKPKG